jgi:hypothetical protein
MNRKVYAGRMLSSKKDMLSNMHGQGHPLTQIGLWGLWGSA